MATPIFIKVVTDDNGTLAAATDAEVVVGRRDLVGDTDYPYDGLLATFKHDANGHYVNSTGDAANDPGEGEWLVVVRKKGRSVVAQKFTFTAKDGILRATPGWTEPGRETVTAATVSLVNFDEARSSDPAASQPPWATDRYTRYLNDSFNANFLRLPSGLEVARKPGTFDDPIAFSQGGETGHLYVAKGAFAKSLQTRGSLLLLVVATDPAFDVGLFVTQTGKTLLLERARGGSAFGPPTRLPQVFTMELVLDPQYKFPDGDPGTPLPSNVIEQVTPQWFW